LVKVLFLYKVKEEEEEEEEERGHRAVWTEYSQKVCES
jgi:hypothetical protein